MDRIDRFKKLCEVKSVIENIRDRSEEGAEKEAFFDHIHNMVKNLLHTVNDLVGDAKHRLELTSDALDELKK